MKDPYEALSGNLGHEDHTTAPISDKFARS